MVNVRLFTLIVFVLVMETIDGKGICEIMGISVCPSGKGVVFESHNTPSMCSDLIKITARNLLGCSSVAFPKGYLVMAYFDNGKMTSIIVSFV